MDAEMNMPFEDTGDDTTQRAPHFQVDVNFCSAVGSTLLPSTSLARAKDQSKASFNSAMQLHKQLDKSARSTGNGYGCSTVDARTANLQRLTTDNAREKSNQRFDERVAYVMSQFRRPGNVQLFVRVGTASAVDVATSFARLVFRYIRAHAERLTGFQRQGGGITAFAWLIMRYFQRRHSDDKAALANDDPVVVLLQSYGDSCGLLHAFQRAAEATRLHGRDAVCGRCGVTVPAVSMRNHACPYRSSPEEFIDGARKRPRSEVMERKAAATTAMFTEEGAYLGMAFTR